MCTLFYCTSKDENLLGFINILFSENQFTALLMSDVTIVFSSKIFANGDDMLSPAKLRTEAFLTLYFAMSLNGQTHFKSLAANAARFLRFL